MRRGLISGLGPAAAAVLLFAAGCDSPTPQDDSPSPTRPPTTTTDPAPQASSGEFPELKVPDGISLLVPIMHGTTAADTPPFPVPEMKYTLYVACTGNGKLSVDNIDAKSFPCDGVVDRHRVTTKNRTHVVKIRPRGTVRWSVAVGDGSDFTFTTPTPTGGQVERS